MKKGRQATLGFVAAVPLFGEHLRLLFLRMLLSDSD